MRIKILFIDDDREFHPLFERRFNQQMPKEKYELVLITDAREALELLKKVPFDIILCDVNMPNMDGLTFLTEVKKINPLIKVIMISGSQDLTTIRKAMNKDAFDFVVKPIDFEDLETTLSSTYEYILEQKAAKQAIDDSIDKIHRTFEQTIHVISTMGELRDPYTAGHQVRVAQLASAIAEDMGCSKEQIYWINVVGILHDIGKICIPTEILSRPGGVSLHELELIKDHAQMGYAILKGIEFPWPVAEIVRQHHERLDGSGYPRGLKDSDILLEAKIVSVADTVEAVSSFRPYRPAMGIEKAAEVIKNESGIFYDPQVVESCLKLIFEKNFQFNYNLNFSMVGLADLKKDLSRKQRSS